MSVRRSLLHLEVPLAAFGAVLVGLAVLFSVTGIPSWIPPAPLVRVGVPSPLTGMTRSFVALASGHVGQAFAWHPLGPLVFAACGAAPIVALVSWLRAGRLALLSSRTLWLVVAAAFAAVWVRQIAVYSVQ